MGAEAEVRQSKNDWRRCQEKKRHPPPCLEGKGQGVAARPHHGSCRAGRRRGCRLHPQIHPASSGSQRWGRVLSLPHVPPLRPLSLLPLDFPSSVVFISSSSSFPRRCPLVVVVPVVHCPSSLPVVTPRVEARGGDVGYPGLGLSLQNVCNLDTIDQ
jgi:hypothetical protein